MELPKIRNSVTCASLIIGVSLAAALVFFGLAPLTGIAVFAVVAALMLGHWLLLVSFIARFPMLAVETLLRFSLVILPAGLALALVFLAGKVDHRSLFAAAAGVLIVPFAVTLNGLAAGIRGCFGSSSRNRGAA
jgi:hypothetical protein